LEFNYDYSHPFFEFFKVFHLEGLNRKEGEKLLLQLGETYKTDVVKNIIENNPGRVEALRRITSGVPRSIILLFEIFLDNETGDSFQDLEIILDRVTPLYKHRMDGLPPQKQEIMDAIALNWDAIAVKDIAKKTRIPGKSVSAQLNELEKNRLVTKIPTSKKNNLYQVSERFFNIWYLMRNGRRRERQKVLWLVRFLESWCGEEYLIDPVNLHSQNLKEGNIKVKALSLSKRAFELVQDKEFVEKPPFILTYACVLLWNDEIEQAIQMADLFIENDGLDNIKGMKDSEITSLYRDSILLFLAKKQYHYVLKLFRENKLNFKDRLKPVYYALMVLMKDTFPDEHKKMDDELKQTVDEVIERINQMAIDYA
ncbi:MAG: MarR family transcriptional regulator, partial [bacterium]|nr:MarR family transcriptional regulator [bacterium]